MPWSSTPDDDLEIRIGDTRRAKNSPFDAGIFYNRDLLEQPDKEILAKNNIVVHYD